MCLDYYFNSKFAPFYNVNIDEMNDAEEAEKNIENIKEYKESCFQTCAKKKRVAEPFCQEVAKLNGMKELIIEKNKQARVRS